MGIRDTKIYIRKDLQIIQKLFYGDICVYNFDEVGTLVYKTNKEKFRFDKNENIKKGDSLILEIIDIPMAIEIDQIRFLFRFDVKGKINDTLVIADNMARGEDTYLLEKTIKIDVRLFSLEEGESGEIIKISFIDIDPSVNVQILGKEKLSEKLIEGLHSSELTLWNIMT